MVTARYPPYSGGIETHVREVAPRVAELGAEVTVLTTDLTGQLSAVEQDGGVEVRRVPAWPRERDWYLAPGIGRIIGERRWDVLHVQGIHTAVAPLAMLSGAATATPFVVTFHTGGHSSAVRSRLRPLQWLALRPLLRRAARLIGVSSFEAEAFRRSLRLRRDRFRVVRNGAGLLAVDGDGDAAAAGDGAQGPILSVGRLERYKGHHRAIAALPHLPPQMRLEILGSGPAESWLLDEARRRGVADRVAIRTIPAEDRAGMAAALRGASAVALLSEYEAHPVAVMEALALGRPVVVADTSGLSELARAGLARAVPVDATPAHVARAILDQIHDPLAVAPERLPTWESCAAQLMTIYREAAGGRA
jgi:glycosyltransferase involved in cell wall biosynthesis